MAQRVERKFTMGAVGLGDERMLNDEESRILKRVLLDETNYFLADFAAFMMWEIEKEHNISRRDAYKGSEIMALGSRAVSYALVFRDAATAEEWPEGVSPPGFIYGYVEEWLDQLGGEIDAIPAAEYFRGAHVDG